MRYETVRNLQFPKIGFGTWSFGGTALEKRPDDDTTLRAFRSALALGYTHFDTAEVYGGGRTEKLLGQAVRESGVPRETLFITTKVSSEHLGYEDVLHACEGSLNRLQMSCVDLYLIHGPQRGMQLEETFRALNQLVRESKVRWVGVSNFNSKQMQQSVALCDTPLLANEVSYSIPDRRNVENGVLDYCQRNDILLIAYSPIKHRNTRSNPVIGKIAEERGLSREQVALAWLTTQPRVVTIPMAYNPQHQAENLAVADLTLTDNEMERLNQSIQKK